MKKVLAVLAVAMLAMPAAAAVDYFATTADGSMVIHPAEGYSNSGNSGYPRLFKQNQHMGFLAFDSAVGDNSGQSLADFIAANGGVIAGAKVYICAQSTFTSDAGILGLRSGNVGSIVEDGPGGGATFDNPAANIAGASEPYAFRSQDPALNVWSAPGMGVDEGWIRPSNSATLNGFAAGQEIAWTAGGDPWEEGVSRGAKYGLQQYYGTWALAYLIGQYNRNTAPSQATVESAGQLVNKDAMGNPVNLTTTSTAADVRGMADGQGQWYAVDLSAEIVNALASDPEMKGLGIYQKLAWITNMDWGNQPFFDRLQNGGVNAAYIALDVVPEPATLALLAMSGLALIRRRK